MKIGIDARLYGPKQGGIGRYLEQIILELEKLDHHNQYVIFLRAANWDDYQPSASNFQKVLADIPWYGWREQILLPSIIARAKVDLMHFPHWNIPWFYHRPFVVTIHDLLLLHYPTRAASTLGPLSYFFKNIAYKIILRHAARSSRHILTVSEYSKQDIIQKLKISADKITVTHLAPTATGIDIQKDDARDQDILKKYHISKPYLLYVGAAFPHKNLDGLMNAWKIFQEKHGQDYELVLAGRNNFFYQKLAQRAQAEKISGIIFTDFVPDADLPTLYRRAALYVFPSLYEGFGLPPLEAMQYGLPVISSNHTCLPEILKNAVGYFDPDNYPQLADMIWQGLTDQSMRTKLVQAGTELIHSYSWEKAAKTTWDTYQKVV